MGVIYRITSPSGRVYVGKTINMKRRLSDYKYKLNGRSSIVINSIKKYGWANHRFEVIEEGIEEVMLDEREMFWISELKTYYFHHPKGMNQTLGGDGQRTTWMHDTQRRKEQSDRFSGEGNPFYGKKHTEEHNKKKSKEVSEYNKRTGRMIPSWGVDKGRLEIARSIVCYDLLGGFICEYKSITDAENKLGIDHSSISMACGGKRSQAGGFIFKFKTENYPLKIEVGKINLKQENKPVIGILNGIIAEFPSPIEAANNYKIPVTTIRRAATYNHGKKIRAGHIFFYKEDYYKQAAHRNGEGSE